MNIEAFLLAIAMVESGGNPGAIGRGGEVSKYQVSPAVWRQHSKVPVAKAPKNPEIARGVARKHLEWIRHHLPADRRNSPYWCAVARNGGLDRAKRVAGATPQKIVDYAFRVETMYHHYATRKSTP